MQDNPEVCDMIFEEFGLDKQTAHIINGHIPVKQTKGESPIKAKGKMIVIDGGMSKPYQKVTGIAGYTLIFDSHSLQLDISFLWNGTCGSRTFFRKGRNSIK